MISINKLLSGPVLIVPVVIGAYLSGAFYLAENYAVPLTLFQLALITSFFLFFLNKVINREFNINVYGIEKWFLAFLLLIFFSIIYSPEREQALFYVIRFIVLIGMTYLVYNSIKNKGQLKIIVIFLITTAVGLSAFNLIEIYFNPEIIAFNYANQGQKLIRQAGTESDPNIFASNFIIPVMFSVAFFGYVKKWRYKIPLFFITALMLVTVLLSYSRSSWVSVFIGVVIVLFLQRKVDFLLYGFISLIILVLLSDSVQQLAFSIVDRLGGALSGSLDDSSRFRILLAVTAVYMFFDTYMLGVGFQGFSTAFQKYHPPQETRGIYEPHNEFYAVLAELGIVGFIIFITIIYLIFKTAKENLKLVDKKSFLSPVSVALFASFISYIVFFQFLSGMLLNALFMICVGFIFTINKLILEEKNNNAASERT